MSIDTTVGGANANSYADFTDYTAYWQSRLFNAVQLAAVQAVAEAALEWAALLLDAGFKWSGSAADGVQAMAWPRLSMFSANGYAIPSNQIPAQLKKAQCEFAGVLFNGDRTADNAALKVLGTETTLSSVKVGPVALTFAGGSFSTLESFDAYVRSLSSDLAYLSKAIPDSVRFLIVPSWYAEASLKRKIIFSNF